MRIFTMLTIAAMTAFLSTTATASINSWPSSKSDNDALQKLKALPPSQLSCEHHGPTVLVEDAYGNDLEIPSREGETCCDYEGSNLCCTNWADGGAPTCNAPPANPNITFTSTGDTTVVEGHGFEAVAEADQISWCHTDQAGVVCDHAETKWGCQYFVEEGSDDVAVCILTTLAENCCECLSVCPGDDEEGQSFDPALLVEVITDTTEPTHTLPGSCRWETGTGFNDCNYSCGGVIKAACKDQWAGDEISCNVGGSYQKFKGDLPCWG